METRKEVVLPSLDTNDGYIKDRTELMRVLFNIYTTSYNYQSNIKTVESVKFDLAKDSYDEAEKAASMKKSIEKLYSVYYDSVVAVVEPVNVDNLIYYKINITAEYQNIEYKLEDRVKSTLHLDEDEFSKKVELYNG